MLASMTSHDGLFRFGIVAPLLSDASSWREQVRRIAGQGYSTVLVPDFR